MTYYDIMFIYIITKFGRIHFDIVIIHCLINGPRVPSGYGVRLRLGRSWARILPGARLSGAYRKKTLDATPASVHPAVMGHH